MMQMAPAAAAFVKALRATEKDRDNLCEKTRKQTIVVRMPRHRRLGGFMALRAGEWRHTQFQQMKLTFEIPPVIHGASAGK